MGESAAQPLWQRNAHCSSVRMTKCRNETGKDEAFGDKNLVTVQFWQSVRASTLVASGRWVRKLAYSIERF